MEGEGVTREEALARIKRRMDWDPSRQTAEALRVLSRPCIELEGWGVESDAGIGDDLTPSTERRVIVLRRKP